MSGNIELWAAGETLRREAAEQARAARTALQAIEYLLDDLKQVNHDVITGILTSSETLSAQKEAAGQRLTELAARLEAIPGLLAELQGALDLPEVGETGKTLLELLIEDSGYQNEEPT